MIFPYVPRLLCLCLALFFFVHLITGMAVWFATPGAIWMAGRMRARSAARFLLALRLLPCAVALFAVAAFCLPSYLSLEPEATTERVGLICLGAALLALASWTRSVRRAWRGVANSMKYVRQCRGSGHEVHLIGAPSPVWVLEAASPLLALVGVIHPRIVISRAVMSALSPEELAAALRHEHAHGLSRDNLKRLLLLLTPDILPLLQTFQRIELEWARFTEWAADDVAVAGDLRKSLSLAATLVRVARICAVAEAAPLLASLVANRSDVPARVDRLLNAGSSSKNSQWATGVIATAALTFTFVLIAPIFASATLPSVHLLLEHLIH